MTQTKRDAHIENLAELVSKHIEVHDAVRLMTIAASLHRLDEAECNYGLTNKQEWREGRLENEATKIAAKYGLKLYRQGDPRGWPLYLYSEQDRLAYSGGQYEVDAIYNSIGIAICPW